MLTSILPNAKRAFTFVLILSICPFLYSFASFLDEQQWINWANKTLNETYDPSAGPQLKKFEISLTADHFIRLRKIYQHGKKEYYSFNLQQFTDIAYRPGLFATDTLLLKTKGEDIIVQTYNDPKGDIDSMATMLSIPVKKITQQRLDSLKLALNFIRADNL